MMHNTLLDLPSLRPAHERHRRARVHLPAAFAIVLLSGLSAPRLTEAQTTSGSDVAAGALKKLSLEELGQVEVVVFGASQHEQRVSEAPSSVTVITADEIREYGFRTLAEVLNSVSGFDLRNDRNFSTIGIRGFGLPGDFNTRFLVLIDSHRTNDAVGDRALSGLQFLLDVDLIERVEIVRGPGSSLYGSNALLGVINVVTRRGRDIGGVDTLGSVGTTDSYKGRLTYGTRFANGAEVTLSGDYFHSAGRDELFFEDFNTPETNSGIAQHADGARARRLFATLSWKHWTLQSASVWPTKAIPTASYGTLFNDPRGETRDGRGYLDLKYERPLENGTNLLVRGAYDKRTTTGVYPYAGESPGESVLNVDELSGNWLTGEVQLRRRVRTRHTVTGGALVMAHLDRTLVNRDIEPAFEYLNERHRGAQYGLYVQDEYQPFSSLIVNAGARYDWFSTFGSALNPRVAVIYNPVAPTALKLLFGRAFRAPSPEELYYHDGGISQVANPELRPERISTYELVVEQRVGSAVRATASAYRYHIDELIQEETLPDSGLITLANLGMARAQGLELGLEAKWPGRLQGRTSYSWQRAVDADAGRPLVNSPGGLFKLNIRSPVDRRGTVVGLDLQHTSARRTLAGATADAYTTANVTVTRGGILRGLDAAVTVYNVFNRAYAVPGGPEHLQDIIPQDGRAFRVQFTRHLALASKGPRP